MGVLGPTPWKIPYDEPFKINPPNGPTLVSFGDDIGLLITAWTKILLMSTTNIALGVWAWNQEHNNTTEQTQSVREFGKTPNWAIESMWWGSPQKWGCEPANAIWSISLPRTFTKWETTWTTGRPAQDEGLAVAVISRIPLPVLLEEAGRKRYRRIQGRYLFELKNMWSNDVVQHQYPWLFYFLDVTMPDAFRCRTLIAMIYWNKKCMLLNYKWLSWPNQSWQVA